MAGLWGAKKIDKNNQIVELANDMLMRQTPRHYWDFDQDLLRRIVWPVAKKDVFQHDSYTCKSSKLNQYHHCQPFPTKRVNSTYVGWSKVRSGKFNVTGIKPCPLECRPKNKKHWHYC